MPEVAFWADNETVIFCNSGTFAAAEPWQILLGHVGSATEMRAGNDVLWKRFGAVAASGGNGKPRRQGAGWIRRLMF